MSSASDRLVVAADRSALAAILDAQGRHREALVPLHEALSMVEAELGREHLEVALLLNLLAAIAGRAGDPQHAETCHLRALAIQRRILGDGHAAVRDTRCHLDALKRRL